MVEDTNKTFGLAYGEFCIVVDMLTNPPNVLWTTIRAVYKPETST